MAPSLVHLPNGQTLTVSSVFAGYSFKSNDLNVHNSAFPPGWTIIIESQEAEDDDVAVDGQEDPSKTRSGHVRRYRNPTLHGDNMFITSISNPSSTDFKPATSPTRQIAMMLWATLWWYFHQPKPNPHVSKNANPNTPEEGRPKGEWRINIKREGIFKGRHLLPKLERMGIIHSEESCVGESIDDRGGEGWNRMFASQRSFWLVDARIFLFTLSPTTHSPFPGASPYPSRPGSPNRDGMTSSRPETHMEMPQGLWTPGAQSPGPFASGSHLPTYYPPPPTLFTFTNNIRHPLRQKPPAQGETFYTRYVPSVGQYLSFRVASLSHKSPTHRGPVSDSTPSFLPPNSGVTPGNLPSIANMTINPCDTDLLHTWMNDPRVNAFWGEAGPRSKQESFLRTALCNKHSFPVIGCWDGKPFGYFEIYWVKEDHLGRQLSSHDYGNWDRGFHALVGEQDFRGPHRVKVWMSALVHFCFLADPRTERVLVEPRVDNKKFIDYLQDVRLQTRTPDGPRGMLNTFVHVLKSDGFLGLYSGLSASLLRQLTYSTTRFGVYEELKDTFTTTYSSPSFPSLIAMASTSGFLGGVAGNPADVLNVRMQHDAALPPFQRRNYKHALDGIIRITREEGWRTLFRGVLPNSMRAVLMTASQLASYDGFKRVILANTSLEDNLSTHFTASFLAGFVATTICSPVDVIKTRIMSAKESEGLASLLARVYKVEGVNWMFRGWVPSFVRLGPHTIATFLFLEQHKKVYRRLKGVEMEG
ncbi:MAG: hypothetical protein Q9222_004245 [Ikaeria aurantiellina]